MAENSKLSSLEIAKQEYDHQEAQELEIRNSINCMRRLLTTVSKARRRAAMRLHDENMKLHKRNGI